MQAEALVHNKSQAEALVHNKSQAEALVHNKSQAPEDGCTNIRNMLSGKQSNNKTSDISWSIFIQ